MYAIHIQSSTCAIIGVIIYTQYENQCSENPFRYVHPFSNCLSTLIMSSTCETVNDDNTVKRLYLIFTGLKETHIRLGQGKIGKSSMFVRQYWMLFGNIRMSREMTVAIAHWGHWWRRLLPTSSIITDAKSVDSNLVDFDRKTCIEQPEIFHNNSYKHSVTSTEQASVNVV